MNKYLLQGKLIGKEGQQSQLADILLQAANLMSSAKGCHVYVIGTHPEDSTAVYITEIWDSKQDHDDSLKIAGVKELITQAMPLLAAAPEKGVELELLGGKGV